MLDLLVMAQQCAPTVAPQTMAAIVQVESSRNPFAIGVVGGKLQRQPKTQAEAVATAKALEADGWNFSVGMAQINRHNLPKYSLSYEDSFDACANVRVGSKILEECFSRALPHSEGNQQRALQAAFSCYYSGNFKRGFQPDRAGEPSYVQKVLAQANVDTKAIPFVPSSAPGTVRPQRVTAAEVAPVKTAPAAARELGPADHAPVLLKRSSEGPARLSSGMTQEAVSPATSITNESAERGSATEKPATEQKRSFNLF